MADKNRLLPDSALDSTLVSFVPSSGPVTWVLITWWFFILFYGWRCLPPENQFWIHGEDVLALWSRRVHFSCRSDWFTESTCTSPMTSQPTSHSPPSVNYVIRTIDTWIHGVKMAKFSDHLFDETHEASSKPPGFVAVTLQWVDSHLRSVLVRHRHNVHCVVGQSCICLE